MKSKTILITIPVLLLILCVVRYPSKVSPPEWEKTHILFDSDEAMRTYDDYLTFNMDGLTVSRAYRCLSFDSPHNLDLKSWSLLEASYILDDSSEISLLVQPNELGSTDGFPVNDVEIHQIDQNGILVMYQEFDDHMYSFRALFVFGGYTYEITLYSPTNPNILDDFLDRIVFPTPNRT